MNHHSQAMHRVSRLAALAIALASLGGGALAQGDAGPASGATPPQTGVMIELNSVAPQDSGACRLSFVARNDHARDISQAVYETVLFDRSGGVRVLTLFDFRALPAARPRVRQFDLAGFGCEELGAVLINGASQCSVARPGGAMGAGLPAAGVPGSAERPEVGAEGKAGGGVGPDPICTEGLILRSRIDTVEMSG